MYAIDSRGGDRWQIDGRSPRLFNQVAPTAGQVLVYNGTTDQAEFSSSLDGITIGSVTPGAGKFTSLTVTGKIAAAPSQGHQFGSASGDSVSPTPANTNILLYNNTSTNWAGIGADTSGGIYLVTGTTSPTTRMLIDNAGKVGLGMTPTDKLEALGANGTYIISTATQGGANTWAGFRTKGSISSAADTWEMIGGSLGGGTTSQWALYHGLSTAHITVSQGVGVRFNQYGAGTLVTDSSGNITASSDERLKNILGDFTAGLEVNRRLHPKSWNWLPETGMVTDEVTVGHTAQDVLQAGLEDAVGTFRTIEDTEDEDVLVAADGQLIQGNEALEVLAESRLEVRQVQKFDANGERVMKRIPADRYTLNQGAILALHTNCINELDARLSALEQAA